jgi:hypothetical protein
MKKILPYLLLNVVVSAATVLIVLLIWNAAHPSIPVGSENAAAAASFSAATGQPTATLPSLNTVLFEVQSVIGAGDLTNEHLHIIYTGKDTLSLQNWTLASGRKTVYTFPVFALYKDGGVDLYTQAGVNSAYELYMGLSAPLWVSGGQLTLRDPAGNVRLSYKIP